MTQILEKIDTNIFNLEKVFVPTMGALHEGHIALIKDAKKFDIPILCSIFINPIQFNDKNDFKKELNIVSPKVIKLLENIKKLDENDLKKYNKNFKHIIYTDVKESSAGSKMIAASFIANGYKNIYDEKLKIIDNNEKNTNIFALLCSVQLYGKPFSVKLKKAILSKFNESIEINSI